MNDCVVGCCATTCNIFMRSDWTSPSWKRDYYRPVSYAADFLQPQRVDQFAFSPLESVEITA
jgi:hypothetical protein